MDQQNQQPTTQGIYPNPENFQQQNQNPNQPQGEQKKPMAAWKICLIVFLVVVVLAIGIVVALFKMTSTAVNSARTKSDDARIKSALSQLRSDAEVYYEKNNNSYVGLDKSSVVETFKSGLYDAELKSQNITKDNYLFYAKLSTGKYFCVSGPGGTTAEVDSVSPSQTTCQ